MPYLIRKAVPNDIRPLGNVLESYMQETYKTAWGGNTQLLEQHLLQKRVELIVAEAREGKIIGFAAWINSYDLHWCVKGGDVIDFFVCPAHRGLGPAILLIAKLAEDVKQQAGAYLRGGAVNSPIVRRLYARVAMCLPSGESYVSGRAFRHLAELSGKSPREIIENLPETAWNQEP